MPPIDLLTELDQLDSSTLILLTLAGLGLAAGILCYVGVVGWIAQVVGLVVRGAVRRGFLVWECLFSWAGWPAFLAIVLTFLVIGCVGGEALPGLAVLFGLVPLLMGVAACLAYMFIDLERYEVERGYKVVHNPMKGQQLARYLVRFGHQVGVAQLAAAAIGVIGGFALLNFGLYRSVGRGWYRLAESDASYPDFLAYALINVYSIVDLLDLASSQHLLRVAHVRQAAWPASTLLILFKTFFTLVLLQQLFASVRKGKLLGEMITDFWSPHEPIHERARSALPQYGAMAIGPLLFSLRSISSLTKEQRDQLPVVLAMIGPSTIPALVRHLHDPYEHVRAVVAAALGQLHAFETLPLLSSLAGDSSDVVRLSAVDAMGNIASTGPGPPLRQRWLRSSPRGMGRLWPWRRQAAPPPPRDMVGMTVATLRNALRDETAAVRARATLALGRIGLPAAHLAGEVIGLLKDADEKVRCQAAEALGCMGGATGKTVDALVAVLQDSSTQVKAAAARALGALKKAAAEAVPALVPLLQDREEAVRTAAAEAIAQTGPLGAQATDALVESLASSDTIVQAQTAEALGTIGMAAQDAAPALVDALGNGSDRVRAKAAAALGKIGETAAPVAVPSLVRALRDKDNWVSALAAEALAEMGESADEAVPALVRSLGHVSPLVRGNAAEALGKMGAAGRGARVALEKAVRDDDGGVRTQAVRALGGLGHPTAATKEAVLDRFHDADPMVRAAAAEATGQWGEANSGTVNGLLLLLEDANDQVKVQVTHVLPKLAGATPTVVDGLCQRLIDDSSTWVQMSAALALGTLGPAAAAAGEHLLRAAQTAEQSVREYAMRALARIQPPEIRQAFAVGLKDASVDVRKVASGGWIKAAAIPEEVIPALVEALCDPEAEVRANAAHALARLDPLPADALPLLIACTADAHDRVRLNAAVALQQAPASTVAETMRQLVGDSNVQVRLVAAGALLNVEPSNPAARAVLDAAVSDAAPRVRKAALKLVESLGATTAPLVVAQQQRQGLNGDAATRPALADLVKPPSLTA